MPFDGFYSPETDEEYARRSAEIDAALEQARAQYDALAKAAQVDQATANAAYSLHDVAGVGRYAVPRRSGWRNLLPIIHEQSANIDFSLRDYPLFDKMLGERFNSPYLLDPLDDHYESYRSLRDNIAAVRNFLMETYFADQKIPPEKAKQMLEEIATFVGDGLYNNWSLLGIFPHHDPMKPWIDLDRARAKGGEGAQYIYEQILKHQRHSSWMHPFALISSFFGGKSTPDWVLPAAGKTGFTSMIEHDILPNSISAAATTAEIEAALARVGQLEAERKQLKGMVELNSMANDLDMIGDRLLVTGKLAENAGALDSIANLSESDRLQAIEIARDILRKLKITLGNLNVMDGLKLKPTDDLAVFWPLQGVAKTYEHLLAWGKKVNPAILNDPTVMAATRAMGQLGYLAKLEALTMAKAAGNTLQVSRLTGELARIDPAYATATDAKFGGLLEKVERGIDTMLKRIQEMTSPGAKVGHQPGNERGQYMNSTPVAGMAMQLGGETGGVKKDAAALNAEMLAAENAANLSRAARTHHENVTKPQAPASPSATTPPRPAIGNPRPAQASRPSVRPSTSGTAPASPVNPAQLQAQRNAANLSAHSHQQEQENALHHQHDAVALQMAARQAAAARAQAQATKAGIKWDTKQMTGAPIATGRVGNFAASLTAKPSPTAAAPSGGKSPLDTQMPTQPQPYTPKSGPGRY